jgi:hypothetical protein
MKRGLILVGSPRGKKSTSTSLGKYLKGRLEEKGLETELLWINRQVTTEQRITEMLEAVDRADIVVLTAPLYDDCQPYIVVKTMEAIAARGKIMGSIRFIPIINCGFPEPEHITAVSISLYHKFATTVGFRWAGSLAVGGGEMLQGASGKTLEDLGKMTARVRRALEEIADALAADNSLPDKSLRTVPNFFYKPVLKKLILGMNNAGWKSRAKKNGAAVDARPFSQK